MIAEKVAVPMPLMLKLPMFKVKFPAPIVRATAAVIRLTLREIYSILYPDAPTGSSDQAKQHNSKSTKHSHRNGCNQCTKLRRETKQDCNTGRENEDKRRVDARNSHYADILSISCHTCSSA